MNGSTIRATHPLLASAVDAVAATYDRFYSADPDAFHPMYLVPRSREDMDRRMEALGHSDITAGTTAACMALIEVAPALGKLRSEYRDRIYEFVEIVQGRRTCAAPRPSPMRRGTGGGARRSRTIPTSTCGSSTGRAMAS